MKKHVALLITLAVFTLFLQGCSSTKPLSLHPARRNIVVQEDHTIMIGEDSIDFRNLRRELVSRMIIEKTPITVHVHNKADERVYDAIIQKLLDEGFKNLDIVVYKD